MIRHDELEKKIRVSYSLRHLDFLQEHILTFGSSSSPEDDIPKPGVAGTVDMVLRTLFNINQENN